MSELKHENRITARTAPQVIEGLNVLLARLKVAGHEFRGRKIGIEGLVGAVLIEFLAQPPDVQAAVLDARLPELEGLTGYAPGVPDAGAGAGEASQARRVGVVKGKKKKTG